MIEKERSPACSTTIIFPLIQARINRKASLSSSDGLTVTLGQHRIQIAMTGILCSFTLQSNTCQFGPKVNCTGVKSEI